MKECVNHERVSVSFILTGEEEGGTDENMLTREC